MLEKSKRFFLRHVIGLRPTLLIICLLHLCVARSRGEKRASLKYREWIEDNDRVEVRSWYGQAGLELKSEWNLDILATIDAWSGATPNGTNPNNALGMNWLTEVPEEIRKAGLFTIGKSNRERLYEFEYGISDEPDYLSRSYAFRYGLKLAEETFVINAGLSLQDDEVLNTWTAEFTDKQTWTASLGFDRILNQSTSLSTNFSVSRPKGYLNDSYKHIIALDESLPSFPVYFPVPENRPDERTLFTFLIGASKYLQPIETGLHGSYRLFLDDHDLEGHTIEINANRKFGDKWMLTPSLRLYSQKETNFYTTENLQFTSALLAPSGGQGPYYSADHRLSSFDSLSWGMKTTFFARKLIRFDFAFDRYESRGTDGITSQLVYPDANVFTFGFTWEL